jgi:succinate dehydrogenase/fumarate reductase flavoprotein subunit
MESRKGALVRSASQWDRVVDVIVVGVGAGGCAAAVSASRQGAETLLLEKLDTPGGTTRKSSGWYWVPNNRWMRERGIEDPKDAFLRYTTALTRRENYNPADPYLGLEPWENALVEAYYDHASPAVDALTEMGALDGEVAWEFPDYYAHHEHNAAPYGRVVIPKGAVEGERGNGQDLMRTLLAAAERQGVKLLTRHAVGQLVVGEDGRVLGVVADHAGNTVAIGARKAAIFATGGYGQNPGLIRDLTAGPIMGSSAARGSTGDFVRLATALGAPLRCTGYPWMAPVVFERALRNEETFWHSFQMPGDSSILVNRFGVRPNNEKLPYHEQALTHWAWDVKHAEFPNLLQFLVWDQYAQEHFTADFPSNPIVAPGGDDAHIVRGDTFEELAEALARRLDSLATHTGGVRLDPGFARELTKSIRRYNGFAATGVDEDFQRGETPFEAFFNEWHGGPLRSETNRTMYPISTSGPYYAAIIAPGLLDTKGGPVTDTEGRVLDVDGKPIPGLYGVGNCVASPSGRAYWAGGATIGPALTFGYLAGRSAARIPALELAET